jgi:hypothetical protein
VGSVRFDRARRSLLQWFLHPNLLSSSQVGMPGGLRFRFKCAGGIEVCAEGQAGANWQKGNGDRLQPTFQETRELLYHPTQDEEIRENTEPITYQIASQKLTSTTSSASMDREDDEMPTPSSRKWKRDKRKKPVTEDEYDW